MPCVDIAQIVFDAVVEQAAAFRTTHALPDSTPLRCVVPLWAALKIPGEVIAQLSCHHVVLEWADTGDQESGTFQMMIYRQGTWVPDAPQSAFESPHEHVRGFHKFRADALC